MAKASTTKRTKRLSEAERAIRHVLSENPQLSLDSAGEPRIRRSFDPGGEIAWRVDSPRIRGWIARVYFENTKAVLRKEAMERVLVLLAGLAEKQDESDLEVCDAADVDPLLRYIIRRVRDEQHLKITAEALLDDLECSTRGRAYLRQESNWPTGPSEVGRRVRALTKQLGKASITLNADQRSNRQRWLIFSLVGDGNPCRPSPSLSSTSPVAGNELRPGDSGDTQADFDLESEFARMMELM